MCVSGPTNDGKGRATRHSVLFCETACGRSRRPKNDEHEIHVRKAHKNQKSLEKRKLTIFTLLLSEHTLLCASEKGGRALSVKLINHHQNHHRRRHKGNSLWRSRITTISSNKTAQKLPMLARVKVRVKIKNYIVSKSRERNSG